MRICRVIGKVVLSERVCNLRGGHLLVVSPYSRSELERHEEMVVAKDPSLVVYDELGAGSGDLVGVTEGGEATLPFDRPVPVDAYLAAIFDNVSVTETE